MKVSLTSKKKDATKLLTEEVFFEEAWRRKHLPMLRYVTAIYDKVWEEWRKNDTR